MTSDTLKPETLPKKDDPALGGLYHTGARFFFILFNGLCHVLLARGLHPEEYGLFLLTMSILTWIELSATRFFCPPIINLLSNNKHRITILFNITWRLFFPITIVTAFILAGFSSIIGDLFSDKDLYWAIPLSAVDIPFYLMFSILSAFAIGQSQYFYSAWALFVYGLSKLVAMSVVFYFLPSTKWALIANALSSISAVAVLLILVWWPNRKNRFDSGETRSFVFRQILSFGGIQFFILTILNIFLALDFWIVKLHYPTGNTEGLYGIATYISQLPYLLLIGIVNILFSEVGQSVSRGDYQSAARSIHKTIRFCLLIWGISLVGVIGAGESLIELVFGVQYAEAGQWLAGKVSAMCLLVVITAFLLALAALDASSVSMILVIVFLPISVFLEWNVLIKYGLNGIPWATFLSMLMMSIVSLFLLHRRLPLSIPWGTISRVAFATICTTPICFWIDNTIHEPITASVISVTIFFIILYVTGEIKKADVNLATHFFAKLKFSLNFNSKKHT